MVNYCRYADGLESRVAPLDKAWSLCTGGFHHDGIAELLSTYRKLLKNGPIDPILEAHLWHCYAIICKEGKKWYLVEPLCNYAMVAVCKVSITERPLVEDLANYILAMAMENKVNMDEERKQTTMADSVKRWNNHALQRMQRFSEPAQYWRDHLSTCQKLFERCQQHYLLPVSVDTTLVTIASYENCELVLATMKGNKSVVYNDEPAMIVAHAFYLRMLIEQDQEHKDWKTHQAHHYAKQVKSAIMYQGENAFILQEIDIAYNRLVEVNLSNVDLEGLSIAQSIEAEGSDDLTNLMGDFKMN